MLLKSFSLSRFTEINSGNEYDFFVFLLWGHDLDYPFHLCIPARLRFAARHFFLPLDVDAALIFPPREDSDDEDVFEVAAALEEAEDAVEGKGRTQNRWLSS